MKRIFFLLLAAMLLSSATMLANSTTYYFNTVKVTASGAGKVYASATQTNEPAYADEVTLDNLGSNSASSVPTMTLYLYAQPDEDYEVASWEKTSESGDLTLNVDAENPNVATATLKGNEATGIEHTIVVTFKKTGLEIGSVEIDTTSMSVDVEATGQLKVRNQSHEGKVSWASDNERVLTVDAETGEWTAVGYGVAVVMATLPANEVYTEATATAVFSVDVPKSMYQVQNGGFELWDNEDSNKIEPKSWNSFMNATGSFSSIVAVKQVQKSNDARPGSEGRFSAHIFSRSVLGNVAQGNLTTGRINGGSMTATDANGNYNYTDTTGADFNQPLTGMPDAIHVWAKSSCSLGGSMACQLHTLPTTGYFQDPQGTSSGHTNAGAICVAEARNGNIAKGEEWQELTIPFVYNDSISSEGGDTVVRPQYALVTISTSGQPGKGNASDFLLIDDLEFVYNSELVEAKLGADTLVFVDGVATVDEQVYDAEQLVLKSNGRGAVIETEYAESLMGNILTITVKGDNLVDDPKNLHVYTVEFNVATSLGEVDAKAVCPEAIFDLSGRRVNRATKGIFIINGKKVER